MTDAEIARALSGATRECRSGLEHDYGGCAAGCMDGYIYVLGERARKACPKGFHLYSKEQQVSLYGKVIECDCHGSRWLSTLRLPDGRWDVDLLIEVLEEVGHEVWYKPCNVHGSDHRGLGCWQIAGAYVHSRVLAVAACEALEIRVQS